MEAYQFYTMYYGTLLIFFVGAPLVFYICTKRRLKKEEFQKRLKYGSDYYDKHVVTMYS